MQSTPRDRISKSQHHWCKLDDERKIITAVCAFSGAKTIVDDALSRARERLIASRTASSHAVEQPHTVREYCYGTPGTSHCSLYLLSVYTFRISFCARIETRVCSLPCFLSLLLLLTSMDTMLLSSLWMLLRIRIPPLRLLA
jgi:hypothetical protein